MRVTPLETRNEDWEEEVCHGEMQPRRPRKQDSRQAPRCGGLAKQRLLALGYRVRLPSLLPAVAWH